MAHKQRREPPPSRNNALLWAVACGVLALGVAGVYLGLYRANGYRLPVGFDASWYAWRASFVAGHGLGPLGTAARPGSEVLAALLGSVTRRAPLVVAVLLPPVLAGVFALGLGAVVRSGLGPCRARWFATVVVGGVLLGATRLVDENVATLLFLAVLVAGLVPMMALAAAAGTSERPVARDPRFWAAVVLLAAAGLAHWLFLAVFGAILGLAALLLWPVSRAQRAAGVALSRTASGVVAGIGAVAAASMAVLIGAILSAPVDTIEVKEDPSRFLPKLGNDVKRLALPVLGPLALVGGFVLRRDVVGSRSEDPRTVGRRVVLCWLLAAWALVCAAGLAFGAATKDLPPHRFVELVLVVPGVIALTELMAIVARRVRARTGRVAAAGVVLAATAALALPGVFGWYGSGAPKPWIDPAALQQARVVGAWSATLPPGTPFVVLVSPFGTAGTLSAALKERTIRVVLPADRQPDFHLFVGTYGELAARMQPTTANPQMNAAILPYWKDVRPLLGSDPPLVLMLAFDEPDFAQLGPLFSVSLGAGVIGLRTTAPPAGFEPPALPDSFPGSLEAAAWVALVLALLGVCGLGWAVAFLGRGASWPVVFGSAPAVGAGMLILAGTLVSRAGGPLGGAAGILTVVGVAASGFVLAAVRRAR